MSDTIADPTASATAQIAEHLSFLGYTAKEDAGSWQASHPTQADVRLRPVLGGTLVVTYFGIKSDLPTALRFVNELNQRGLVARFLVDKDGDFAMEGWIAAPYERAAFSAWIDAWQRDFGAVVSNPEAASILK